MLAETGDHADAADLMRQALELVPDWAAGWFRLADYEEKSGGKEAAVAALKRVMELNPDDIFGAGLKLALLGGAETPEQPPSSYVERLFDDYADRFDAALVERLNYTVPQKLAALIADHAGETRFSHTIDLGCGTGLAAGAFARHVDRFIGIDLSPRMIDKARATGLYAELEVDDMLNGIAGKPDASAELILAADAMVYIADLAPVLAEARRVLVAGGVFAFTTETHDGEGVILGEGLRYAEDVTAGKRAAADDVELLAAFPRYHPWWAWWVTRVPVLREFAVSNLVLVLRKDG